MTKPDFTTFFEVGIKSTPRSLSKHRNCEVDTLRESMYSYGRFFQKPAVEIKSWPNGLETGKKTPNPYKSQSRDHTMLQQAVKVG